MLKHAVFLAKYCALNIAVVLTFAHLMILWKTKLNSSEINQILLTLLMTVEWTTSGMLVEPQVSYSSVVYRSNITMLQETSRWGGFFIELHCVHNLPYTGFYI
jgi:hypothetical protein